MIDVKYILHQKSARHTKGGVRMGDMGEMWREYKEAKRNLRDKYGIDCPGCIKQQPKRDPTILLPQQKCRVCGYRDPRPRINKEESSDE